MKARRTESKAQCMYRLSHEGQGNISFMAQGTISYFVTNDCSERGTKYVIVTRIGNHILVPLSGAKIRLYFQVINTLS